MSNREDLENWLNYWDDALKSDLFKTNKESEEVTNSEDFDFDKDWNIIVESNKKAVGDKAEIMGNSPNPIKSSSVGQDTKTKPTPNWTSGEILDKLADMQYNLYDLECKLNTHIADAANEKTIDKIKSQIKETSEKIKELSASLTPDFISNHLS